MNSLIGYYRFLIEKESALKYSFVTAAIAFALSVSLTITTLILQCSYSLLYAPCPTLLPNNPKTCSELEIDYCCGREGTQRCLDFPSCQVKPGIGLCLAFLIVTWLSYLTFMTAVLCFVVVQRRTAREWGEEYAQLNRGIEISQRRDG